MMKLILLLFSILFSLANSSVQLSEDPVIMAYYVPERDYKPEQIPVEKLTHIIYSFSKVIDGKMQLSNPRKAGEKLKQLVDQKKRNKDLKVMIACGGWGAGGFSEMAWTPEGRNKFVESAIAFIEEYKLDGMDMDWEYPTSSSAGIGASPEDKQNFTSLMKQLREALDELDRPQVLTFASAGWKDYYNYIETEEVMKYVDYMNVMTYDQIVSTSPYTGHHTPLGYITEVSMEGYPLYEHMQSRKEEMAKRGRTWEPRSVKKIIEFCLAQGVKPEQLVIGAAFYGRAWKGVDPAMNGLYQKNRGEYIGWSAYSQIRSEFEKDKNFTRHWDSIAMAPYLYSVKDSIFITYDDPESVTLKTRYAIEEKLGGIMFWQLGNDTKEENGLLDAIYEESVR